MNATTQTEPKYSRACRFAYKLAIGSRFMEILSILSIAAGMNVVTGLIPPQKTENLLYQRHALWVIVLALAFCGGGIICGYLGAVLRQHLDIAEKAVVASKEFGKEAILARFKGNTEDGINQIMFWSALASTMLVAGAILAYQLMVGRV